MPENTVTKLFPGKSDQWCHEHLWAASRHQGLQVSCLQTPNGVQIYPLESNCRDLQKVIAAQNVQVTHSSGKIPYSVQTLGLYQTSRRWWEVRTGRLRDPPVWAYMPLWSIPMPWLMWLAVTKLWSLMDSPLFLRIRRLPGFITVQPIHNAFRIIFPSTPLPPL